MAESFKSHVLRRDEKGLFGVPFKRLLLAGVGAGLTYTVVNLGVRGWSIPVAVVAGIGILVMTSPRGGIPLWGRLLYRVRGSLSMPKTYERAVALVGIIQAYEVHLPGVRR